MNTQLAAASRSSPRHRVQRDNNNEEWRKWPAVKALIPNLPQGTTTLDIHKNLQRFGSVEYIRIEETRQGAFARKALVTFKPPPPRRAPWHPAYARGIDFVIKRSHGEQNHLVKVLYSSAQSQTQSVESPVGRTIRYPSDMVLPADSIDFGYLERPTSMVVKATKRDVEGGSIKLMLNLKRLELEVHFPVVMKSKGVSTTRAYRFFVALDDQFSLCEVQQGNTVSLVIHLKNPPWYSRQLRDAMAMSHAPDSHKWSADDAWTRQTDIVEDKEKFELVDNSPISVRKAYNNIDIARWTTFRITVKPSVTTGPHSLLRQFIKALEDFNVAVTLNPAYRITNQYGTEAKIWKVLDAGETQSFSEQLTKVYLPFELRYQLEVCISQGWLNEYTLTEAFLQRLLSLAPHRAKQMLIHVDSYQQRVYDPMDIFTDLKYSKPVRAGPLPDNCVEIYHATVTATGILFHTPSVEVTNRVVRTHQRHTDHFLRVRFEDDSYRGRSRLYPAINGRMKLIFERVRRTMRHGIVLGERHYHFLAWGNSQLREHGAYFFAPVNNITPESIREEMGVFDREKVVAKRAARMGQCFSTTKPVSVVSKRAWKKDPMPDIINGQYNFTDGVGKISSLTARLVHTYLKLKGPVPSAFQFRLGGCKGVLVVDPALNGVDIKIRPSQYKFDSNSDELEIIRVSEFWQPFLNRQLILVLSDLGVKDHVFLRKQEDCIEALDLALEDDQAALRALRDNVDPNLITLNIATMIEDGFRQTNDPFVTSLLRLYRAWTLKYLKEKAKIPVAQGAFVLGVVDETKTLRGHTNDAKKLKTDKDDKTALLPEIFMQYTDQHTGKRRIVEGVCIVARNPSLHRGDIRVVRAINVDKLHHLTDVVVMPGTGDRDLPSMCSGGDLDGDDYVVIWDPDLVPPEWNAEAFDYEAPRPVTKEKISTNDIIDFFYDYMQNDYLGRIAHAHLAAADYLDEGIRSEQCLELVRLHSMAVDYPKTGVPAQMPRALERTKWPHFMEKKRSGEYRSHKILGKLYDAVERVNFEANWEGTFDQRILCHKLPPQEVLAEVKKLKRSYDESMRRIMAQHQIASEFEVWSTFVMHHSKAARDFKFHEEIGQHSKTLKDQYYEAFVQEAGGSGFQKLVPLAVAAYYVTQQEFLHFKTEVDSHDQNESGDGEQITPEDPFISFPWVLQDVLGKIARSTVLDQSESPQLDVGNTNKETQHLKAVLDVLDNEERNVKWTRVGEHLPDPYVPEAAGVKNVHDETQEEAAASVPATPIALPFIPKNGETIQEDAAAPSDRSMGPPPLRVVTSNSKGRDGHSTSESGSVISSGMVSVFSNVEDPASSPDDVHPGSVLSLHSSSSVSRASNHSRGSHHSLDRVQSDSANAPKVDATEQQMFMDPAKMSMEEVTASGLIKDDDEDDFNY
ncbi:RNA-directed RNA polymerase [Exophiala viscosa]|uniref:RNA-dependent RNA polymerase n=1 Tax=Exophiala viscosa TaxID=2486360 RepID=A0AAN6IC27_9EURO|nr:RNA-directed RNA polymerase [Exophiala viscosa]